MISLLAACGSNGVNTDVPAGGEELDIYSTQEEAKTKAQNDLTDGLETAFDGFEGAEAFALESKTSASAKVGLDAALDLSSFATFLKLKEEDAKNLPVTLNAEVGGKATLTAGVGGLGKTAKAEDFVAYGKLNDVEGNLKFDYSVPEAIFPMLTGLLGNYVKIDLSSIKASNSFSYNLDKSNASAYVTDSKLYFDASNSNIEKFYNQIAATEFVASEDEEEGFKLPSYSDLLETIGLTELKGFIDLAKAGVKIDPSSVDVSSILPNAETLKEFPAVLDQAKDVLQALNLKAFNYKADSKYAVAFKFGLNKAGLESLYVAATAAATSGQEGSEKTYPATLSEFLDQYGVTINAFDVEFSVALAKDGGIEAGASCNIDVKADLAKALENYAAGYSSMVKKADFSFKASFEESFNFKKVNTTDVKAALPASFEGYKEVVFPSNGEAE